MPLSLKQQEIADCPTRFRTVVAGRRGGKTQLALREMARFSAPPNQVVWFMAATRQQGKSLCFNKLLKKLMSLRWVAHVNNSDLDITLKNGTVISIRSAEQGDALRGNKINFIVLDEFYDLDEYIWQQVIRPALSDTKGHALFLGTPKAGNLHAKSLFENHLTKANWASFTYTTLEGGFVDKEEVDQARIDLDPRTFRQEYEASHETFTGLIFSEFGKHNIGEVKPPGPNEAIILGTDYNVNPFFSVVGRVTKTGIEIFDEIVLNDSNTSELITEVRTRYPLNPITAYTDPSGNQRRTSANGHTDHKLMQNAGFILKHHHTASLVRDRINAANSLAFIRPDGTTRYKIDPKCKKTIACFNNYAYKEDSQVPNKTKGWDGGFDAATYMVEYLFPVTRIIKPGIPTRFGVGIS